MGNNRGVPRLALFLLALLLGGCRYTFWPPIPPEAPPPHRLVAEVGLEPGEAQVRAAIRVLRVPEAGYLEALWYRDEKRIWHRAFFLEAPTTLEVALPYPGKGSYRLELHWQGEAVAAALFGAPTPPKATPPEWKGN